MIATKSVAACRGLRTPLVPTRAFGSKRQSVVVRFKDNDKPNSAKSDVEQLEKELQNTGNRPTDPKLSAEQFDQVITHSAAVTHLHWVHQSETATCSIVETTICKEFLSV